MLSCVWGGVYHGRKEGNGLFNDALNTFLFTVIWRLISSNLYIYISII